MSDIPPPSPSQTITGNENIQVAGHHNIINRVTQLFQLDRSQVTRRNRRAMLELVKKTWIKEVLEKSLYCEMLIELGLEERPGAVQRPWDIQLQMPDQSPRLLSHGTSISHIFDGLNHTLLILGEPGAGKTTTLLELARDNIARAEQDETLPIPVVFNLSSWSPSHSIAHWLVSELTTKYNIPYKVSHLWMEQDELLLLLDGLDEVKVEHQEACVKAINDFRGEHGLTPLVVCSRINDYEGLSTRLNLSGAILLQPLTPQQLNDYFERIGHKLAAVHQALQNNSALQKLAQQPLMLSIMVLAYRDIPVEVLVREQYDTTQAWQEHLFDTYIKQMFNRTARTRNEPYSSSQTIRWLTWLAQKMIEHSQTVFFLERLNDSWLPTRRQQRLCRLVSTFVGRLFGGVNLGLLGVGVGIERSGMRGGIIGGVLGFLLGWWVFGQLSSDPEASESLEWSLKNALIGIISGALFGLIFSLIGDKFGVLVTGLISGVIWGLLLGFNILDREQYRSSEWSWTLALIGFAIGLGAGVSAALLVWKKAIMYFGFIFALIGGLSNADVQSKSTPNQGFRQSIKHAAILGSTFGLFMGMLFRWVTGLSVGLMTGLIYGGNFVLTHSTLRFFLHRNDNTPWNYTHFLDYTVERIFLRKVGGGYLFVHRLLMEHFAEIKFDEKEAGVLAHRGETYRLMSKYKQAIADFDSAIQLDEKDVWALAHRGETYRLMGKYEQAIADFNRAIALNKKNDWAIKSRGQTYQQMGKYEQALADFDRAIRLDKENEWTLAQRGQTYQLMGKYEQALAELNHAIAVNKEYRWAITLRGETYQLMGKYEQAIADFNYAIQLDEKYDFAFFNRGYTYRLMGKYEEALADLNHAVALDAKSNLPSRGETYRRLGEYEKAISDFTAAIILNPKNSFALCRRAAVFLVTGNTEAAQADLGKAMELLVDNASNLYEKAVIFVLYNRYAEAIETLKQAFMQEPTERIYAQTDDLLAPLHKLPEFQAIMK